MRRLDVIDDDQLLRVEEISEKYIIHYLKTGSFARSVIVEEKEDVRTHKYVYDYQFIHKDNKKSEKRILLEKDGVPKREEIKSLNTAMFHFENVIFGPNTLLGEDRQQFFFYQMIGEEFIDGERALIIEARPRSWVPRKIQSGKIWIKDKDFSILKIEWDQGLMLQSEAVKKLAKKYKAKPQIRQTTEFGFEKNGIRFPSLYTIEEVYIKKNGKKKVHSETNVIYKDYRYFTVETEVDLKLKKRHFFQFVTHTILNSVFMVLLTDALTY